MLSLQDVEDAATIVYAAMPPTPQYAWPLLAKRTGCEVWVKHENHTPIGAFKVRGGLVYMNQLKRDPTRVKGVVSATRGNHGQSIALAAAKAGIAATIVVPQGNSVEKNAAMRAFGAELIEAGHDFDAARDTAVRLAGERGLLMMGPDCGTAILDGVAEEHVTWLAARSPSGRMIEPDEVASLAVFLALDSSRGINGQAINVDGGEVTF